MDEKEFTQTKRKENNETPLEGGGAKRARRATHDQPLRGMKDRAFK